MNKRNRGRWSDRSSLNSLKRTQSQVQTKTHTHKFWISLRNWGEKIQLKGLDQNRTNDNSSLGVFVCVCVCACLSCDKVEVRANQSMHSRSSILHCARVVGLVQTTIVNKSINQFFLKKGEYYSNQLKVVKGPNSKLVSSPCYCYYFSLISFQIKLHGPLIGSIWNGGTSHHCLSLVFP